MKGGIWPVSIDGRPVNRSENQNAFLRYVTPGYFATLAIPITSGRDIDDGDTHDRQYVAVVSESFVKRLPAGRDAGVGASDTTSRSRSTIASSPASPAMCACADSSRRRSRRSTCRSSRWTTATSSDTSRAPLIVRTTVPPETLAAPIRAIIQQIDPTLPVADVSTLVEVVERDTASRSAQVSVLAAFAVIAFVLAGIGIHGLLSFSVSQRAQEIGVRMALGAQSGDILRMIVRRSVLLALAGVIPGIALAYVAGRSMEALLAGVKPADLPTMAAAVGLSVLMTIVGSVMPTLRALRVDPISASGGVSGASRELDTSSKREPRARGRCIAARCVRRFDPPRHE